jgi:ELWxxDGT repeat protein
VTDGTAAGTHELTGIKGASANGLQPTDLTVFGKEVLFAGVDAAGNIGLWATNGTVAGTHEIMSGSSQGFQGGLKPVFLTVFNGEVYFNGAGALWVTDGTAAGTHELTNAVQGPSELAILVGLGAVGHTDFVA